MDPSSPEELTPLPPDLMQKIHEIVMLSATHSPPLAIDLIEQIIYASLKMLGEDYDMGQLKLITRAFKEMRYAYSVFNRHRNGRCVSIFGSARTPESHRNYQLAKSLSAAMAAQGWDCITGAADGIMRAGLEGASRESSFGLSIRLPFEETTHALLSGDPKLISFRYFFTRKLMFLSYSDAIVVFPGGVGTQDELFEALTLMQTGRSNIVPLVLVEEEHGTYWQAWEDYIQNNLLANGWISPEDRHFYYRAHSVSDAIRYVLTFYKRYHSSRYVRDSLIIRLLTPLTEEQIALLNVEFQPLIKTGTIYSSSPFPEETDHLNLPRLVFEHHRRQYGLVKALIDRINAFD